MSKQITQYRVFIATPGGLDDVREAFRDELQLYNESEAVHRGVMFWPVGWEDTLPGKGRPQSLINEELRACDAFLLVLWNRWGSRPSTKGPYTSGSEEELAIATECLGDEKPMSDMVVLFKAVDPAQLANPGAQLKKVLKFKKRLERIKEHYFGEFDELRLFRQLLRKQLAAWVRAHEQEDRLGPAPVYPTTDDSTAAEPVEYGETPGNSDLDQAQQLADEGRLTDAEAIFARLIVAENDPDAFNRYGHFLKRVGRLAQAEVMYQRVLKLAETSGEEWSAIAYGNLGVIYRIRGELDQAEEMQREALEINEQLGRREGMATAYGSLGNIYRIRGELDQAEEMHRKALEISEQLGSREGMAIAYGNLGNIYRIRGELDQAEEMLKKALEINEQLGRREGMANQYKNLGNIYIIRGELDEAEEVLRRALEINEQVGSREGMATAYVSLGLIYKTRDELDQAEEMLRKALEINEQLGRREGMAIVYDNLGNICRIRGELDQGEEMLQKALEINEQLGRREGMATAYGNLGLIYETRAELDQAKAAWVKSRDLFSALGAPQKVATVERWLAELNDAEG